MDGRNIGWLGLDTTLTKMEGTPVEIQDPLGEIKLGTNRKPRINYISGLLLDKLKLNLKELLREFKNCFAWDCNEMLGLSRKLVEHRSLIKPRYKPYRKPPKSMSNEVELKAKEEIQWLLR